ncbi:exodeoxyribonuclease V subunit alpha [Morganella morganii]|uniref:exodeoxyribonuclease V subunit alpha n=1 Tax=Morganella morganii TaxID=582 RepID=UPI0016467E5D|nr:exodeoxyribonuclease V subunit alpha [Morganella morganii]MBC3997158.1 exodeoxyribonuclease V subunit alpha [Morganella morganii]
MNTHLQTLCAEQILRPLDCQFAAMLAPDSHPLLQLVFALLSAQTGGGHVCLPLSRIIPAAEQGGRHAEIMQSVWRELNEPGLPEIKAALSASDAVSDGSLPSPVVLSEENLYLHRMWQYECRVAEFFSRPQRVSAETEKLRPVLDALFGTEEPEDWQKIAAAVAVSSRTAVISGGPGTGKTTTVARILAALVQSAADPLLIELAAPTGKAAARLTESLGEAIAQLDLTDAQRAMMPEQAKTLHRLLGAQPDSRRLRHHQKNPLMSDVLIVDEASMVDLPMMAALIDALPENAMLILLGDKDQLASVEAGAVLGDICRFAESGYTPQRRQALEAMTGCVLPDKSPAHPVNVQDHLCLLRKSFRFDAGSGIGQLATAVNNGDVRETMAVLGGQRPDVRYVPLENEDGYAQVLTDTMKAYLPFLSLVKQHADPAAVLDAFSQFRLLCALREGPFGVEGLNERIERLLHQQGHIRRPLIHRHRAYHGKPVMISRNDSPLGLFNGDIGIMLTDENHELRVYFRLPDGTIRSIRPSRLPAHETAYVMTVHKSQGSEFAHTALVLPVQPSPLVSRELLYTALTRAKQFLTIYSREECVKRAVKTPTQRYSGLSGRLR